MGGGQPYHHPHGYPGGRRGGGRAVQLVRAAWHPDFPVPAFHGRGVRPANIAGVLEKAPFLVAITPDGRLQGFACAHPWHSREAYAWNVEATIYCAPDCIGQGLGKRLYTALLELLRMQGYYNAFAIVTGENKASHEFHKRMGFTKSFVERHSGYKFAAGWMWCTGSIPLRTGEAPPEPVRYRLTEAEMVSILGKS